MQNRQKAPAHQKQKTLPKISSSSRNSRSTDEVIDENAQISKVIKRSLRSSSQISKKSATAVTNTFGNDNALRRNNSNKLSKQPVLCFETVYKYKLRKAVPFKTESLPKSIKTGSEVIAVTYYKCIENDQSAKTPILLKILLCDEAMHDNHAPPASLQSCNSEPQMTVSDDAILDLAIEMEYDYERSIDEPIDVTAADFSNELISGLGGIDENDLLDDLHVTTDFLIQNYIF